MFRGNDLCITRRSFQSVLENVVADEYFEWFDDDDEVPRRSVFS